MVSVPARWQQVAYGRELGLSARRACTLFASPIKVEVSQPQGNEGCARGRADDRAVGAVSPLRVSAHPYFSRPRRPCHEPWPGAPAVADGAVQVSRKRPRKRVAAAARPRPQAPSEPNQVWSYDFVFDHCANGQQLKCVTVTDEFTTTAARNFPKPRLLQLAA
jgi:putative transposase